MTDTTYGLAGDWWVLVASLLFFAIMALVAIRFVGTMRERTSEFAATEPGEDEAIRRLGDRYERGEIDLETYQRMRAELEQR